MQTDDERRAYQREYRARNRAKWAAKAREWREANPEKVKENSKSYYWANRNRLLARMRMNQLRRDYGITSEQYDAMLKAQGGQCAICGSKHPGRRNGCFAVDHCHKTKRVRALLCIQCNSTLANAKDSIERLELAIEYLRRHSG